MIMAKKRPTIKEEKLDIIKKFKPKLYDRVMKGEVNIHDAYNKVMSELNITKEYKGTGTRGRYKEGLSKDIDVLFNKYNKPDLKEWLKELERIFPFTFKDGLRDYLEK
jgi:hypothetical protein|tara:strand:+ start:1880 stop:2203 length:324 start_codon:yes stop_codon:yes gene_type:complete